MLKIVQVRLKESDKVLFFKAPEFEVENGDLVIFEADRGVDCGEVISEPEVVLDSDMPESLNKIIRVANRDDLRRIRDNKRRAKEALLTCDKRVQQYKLVMKLVNAEYSFDRSKITFYFTAEGRIDFRELVKDLARIFKTRIELKQIGVRDETKMFGGVGPCGRTLCCAHFLKNFEPVTIRMAKDQNLPLNPSKISGLCGRLMCCLQFEYTLYKEAMRGLPKIGQNIDTPQGRGKIVEVNPLKRTVVVEVGEELKRVTIHYQDKKAHK